MKIEYWLPDRGRQAARTEALGPELLRRPPRVTCLLALAHRCEELVRSGQVKDYADLARLGRVSRARISQILKLLTLAPSIQDHILWLPARTFGESSITERDLRPIVGEVRWDQQCVLFERLVA